MHTGKLAKLLSPFHGTEDLTQKHQKAPQTSPRADPLRYGNT